MYAIMPLAEITLEHYNHTYSVYQEINESSVNVLGVLITLWWLVMLVVLGNCRLCLKNVTSGVCESVC
jgi:hypothetical protein